MKNQYFGDKHDFKKYMMLRSLIKNNDIKLLIAWYLTENDEKDEKKPDKKDGEYRQYLNSDNEYSKADRELWDWLRREIHDVKREHRNVNIIEKSSMLGSKTLFFSEILKESTDRSKWFGKLCERSKKADIIFLDPDNGIKYNGKNSIKHVSIGEIKKLWEEKKSLIIYQHTPHIDHDVFAYGTMIKLSKQLEEEPFIAAVKSSNVMYFFVLQKEHIKYFNELKEDCKTWNKLLEVIDFQING